MLLVAGQIPRDMIGVNRGLLHEIDDQLEAVKSVTKWAARVLNADEVPSAVHEAFKQLSTGRPRPVEIEIPPDTLAESLDVELLEPAIHGRMEPPADSIGEAARLLAGHDGKVVIWAGGGANSEAASAALTRLAEHIQAPVLTTGEGKGAISDRHYLSVGSPRLREEAMQGLVAKHPVVLAVGTRLATANLPEGHRVIQIDVDPEEIGRNYRDVTMPVLGDAAVSLERLHEAVSGLAGPSASRQAEFEAFRAERFDPANLMEPQASFMRAIRNALPDDGIFISGMTQIGYFSRAYYPVYKPGTYITSSYSGNPGLCIPDGAGGEGGAAGPAGRVRRGRRGVHVQRAGAGDGGAVRHQHRDGRVQRQRLRERAAGAGAPVQQPTPTARTCTTPTSSAWPSPSARGECGCTTPTRWRRPSGRPSPSRRRRSLRCRWG